MAFWYYRRMALMLLLTVGGGCWFFYDGKFGWPAKNVVFYAKEAFDSGGNGEGWLEFKERMLGADAIIGKESLKLLQKAHVDGGEEQTWEEFSKSTKGKSVLQKVNSDKAEDAFRNGQQRKTTWEDYAKIKKYPKDKESAMQRGGDGLNEFEGYYNAFAAATDKRDWAVYGVISSNEKGWEVKDPKSHSTSEIKGQITIGFCLWIGAIFIFVNALINSRRVLVADADNLVSEKGEIIPFQSIFRIDTRKWAKKGLAYVFYEEGESSRKRAVIDDLKFIGADLILDRLKGRISGEIVEAVNSKEPSAEE